MEPKDWIAIASISATVLIFIITLLSNWKREQRQQERDDRTRKEQQNREDELRRQHQEREDKLRKRERVNVPHIEIDIECNIYGPEINEYICEILLKVRNKGLVRQIFRNIRLRAKGIEKGEQLTYWKNHEPRLEFPVDLVDDVSIIPENVGGYFVERGVEVLFTYVTKIPISLNYILIHAMFEYSENSKHTTERVFEVRINNETKKKLTNPT